MSKIYISEIVAASSALFSVPIESTYRARQRNSPAIAARHVSIYLARQLTRWSLPQLGRKFGGLHHTTILHSQRLVADAVAGGDQKICGQVLAVKEILHHRRQARPPQPQFRSSIGGGI